MAELFEFLCIRQSVLLYKVGLKNEGARVGSKFVNTLAALFLCLPVVALANDTSFVGSKACSECHPDQYKSFSANSKKAHSYKSIKIMADKLTPQELTECYGCHTTGYGKPGGFVSFENTPELANAGCEVCHGPGSAHVNASGDATLIVTKPTLESCKVCHNEARVRSFGFKPLKFAGAH